MAAKVARIGIGLYRAGLLAGIGALLWMQQQFVTRERFDAYLQQRAEMEREVIANVKGRLERIERKLDNF